PGENVDIEALKGKTTDDRRPTIQTPPSPASQPPSKTNGTPLTSRPLGVQPLTSTFLRISPIARRLADELGIDPRQVTGTGPDGRITKKDVEAFTKSPSPSSSSFSSLRSVASVPSVDEKTVPLTKLRAAIARRMIESKTSVPHFYVTSDVDMDAVMTLRKQLNDMLGESGKLSVNDFILKAAALALRDFPNLNASFGGDRLIRHGHIHLGIAVSVEGGLLTVVVKDADAKSLSQIGAESKAMAARARAGKVKPEDVEGSTFTLSNLGMFDVDSFTAIINPPEAAILAVGSVRQTPVVRDGALTVGQMMKATLSADHRATDGAEAAQFMQSFKKKLEEPLRLLL
ncbi:MAG: dihydrolipoamide acetyltransferase family protein, partial [Chloroflexota bacterium]